jgi:hypothetical protein
MTRLEPPLKSTNFLSIDMVTGKVIDEKSPSEGVCDFEELLSKLDEVTPYETTEVLKIATLGTDHQNLPNDLIENKKEVGEYQFVSLPILNGLKTSLSDIPSQQLNELMRTLCFPKDKSHFSYLEIRNKICAINLVLNERHQLAPQFRSMCKPPRVSEKKYNKSDSILSNDRQIIDLHWLWLSHQKHSHIEPLEYKGLLSGKNFDWELAERFVKHVGKTGLKADLLGLTELEGLMLFSIQSKASKDRLYTISRAYHEAVRKIRTAVLSPKSKFPADNLENTYKIYSALKIARGSPSQAAEIYNLITTEDIDQKKVSKIKKWLLKNKINLE